MSYGNEQLQMAMDVHDTQHGGKGLGDERGDSCPGHAHAEHEDKPQIEQDIEHRRGDKEIKRLARVAQGADKARQQIVGHGKGNGQKVD